MVSHTSHGVRAALLGVPELWSKVSILPAELWPMSSPVYQDVLSSYLERSDPLPFDARLMLAGNALQVSEQIALLAGHMHRMVALRLVCADADSEDGFPWHSWSSLLRGILGEPAPQLATLHIFYTYVSSVEETFAFEPLVLRDIFCVAAPSLRRVKLSAVRLPATLDYPAFQNVTCFSYDLYGRTTASDLRILSQMPRLEVFHWGGEFAPSENDTDCSLAESCPRTLHTVLLAFRTDMSAPALRRILPLRRLHELWIARALPETGETIPSLYTESAVQGASVCCNSSGLSALLHVVHPGDGGTTRLVVNARHPQTLVSSLLSPFAAITWLTIYDYLWDSDVTGAPPVLPAVTVLTICLASFDDYAREWNGRFFFGPCEWSASIFTADPASRWTLPALREVRVTSQPQAERGPASAGERTLSVSLEDIARWLRHGIAIEPPGRKLDALVLSGLRIIDHNFCAAWETIMALSHSLELSEKPDTLHHTAAADMDFRLRSESFTGDGPWVW